MAVCTIVVEAYRLDRYDNFALANSSWSTTVVEAYRLDRYDNFCGSDLLGVAPSCRSLSFG